MNFSDVPIRSFGHTIQLAAAVYTGEGKSYLVVLPEDAGSVRSSELEVIDMTTEDWVAMLRQTDLLETEIWQRASDGTVAKAIVRKSQRQIDLNVSWAVFRRDQYQCCYCGNAKVPLTVDHLVLWEEGGPSEASNLISACKKCNKTRGNTQYEDWLKSPYYQRVSTNLSEERRRANEALVFSLAAIPKMVHTRSR